VNVQTHLQQTRRPKGEGSISYNADTKTYKVRLTYGNKKNGKPDRRTRTASSEKEAKMLLRVMKKERDSAVNIAASTMTVEEYFKKWHSVKRLEVVEGSHLRIGYSVKIIIK